MTEYEFAAWMTERQYGFAAWIAEWRGDSLQSIGDLYLRAAWCCNDFNKARMERFYRLKALEYFERAMEFKEIPVSDISLYTYLIGELHRRVRGDWYSECLGLTEWLKRPREIPNSSGLWSLLSSRRPNQKSSSVARKIFDPSSFQCVFFS